VSTCANNPHLGISLVDFERDVVEGGPVAKPFGQLVDDKGGLALRFD